MALVAMQFQDRVSQILDHVRGNMAERTGMIEDHQNTGIEGFLEKMAAQYTETNEREAHRKLTEKEISGAPDESDDSEVVFLKGNADGENNTYRR